jgi:hypothetical protein
MSPEGGGEKHRENLPNPNTLSPVCTQFARGVADPLQLARLLGELAALPDDTRRALASLLVSPGSAGMGGEPPGPNR